MKTSSSPQSPKKAFLSTFLYDNLVLVQAIGLCPIIAGGTTLKQAVVLAICTFVTLIPASLIMSLFERFLPRFLHPAIYCLLAAGLLFGASYLLNTYISTELYASLYLFLPLLAVNTLFAYHNESSSTPNLALDFSDTFASSLGFAVVICISGAIREIAAFNTIWNIPLHLRYDLPEASSSFAAFILLALMAALLQWIKGKTSKKEDTVEEVAQDE